MCVGQYTIAMVEVTTQEYVDNISYTVFPIEVHSIIKLLTIFNLTIETEFFLI
jgi:hypothetical protein